MNTRSHHMSNECFDRLIISQFANVNLLICAATGEWVVCLPVYIKSRRIVEWELLGGFTGDGVPNDRCLVDASRENVVAALIPLKRKYRSLMLTESVCKTTFGCPDASIAIIWPSRQIGAVAIPIEWSHIFVGWNLCSTFVDAMAKDKLLATRCVIRHIPNSGGAIAWPTSEKITHGVPCAYEDFTFVASQNCRFVLLNLNKVVSIHLIFNDAIALLSSPSSVCCIGCLIAVCICHFRHGRFCFVHLILAIRYYFRHYSVDETQLLDNLLLSS